MERLGYLLALTVTLAIEMTLGCDPPDSYRFFCGYPLQNSPQTIGVCTLPGERCVCEFHACAQPSASATDLSCSSGYVYREWPFAPANRAQTCVTEAELATALPAGSRNACPDAPIFDFAVPMDVAVPMDFTSKVGGDQ